MGFLTFVDSLIRTVPRQLVPRQLVPRQLVLRQLVPRQLEQKSFFRIYEK